MVWVDYCAVLYIIISMISTYKNNTTPYDQLFSCSLTTLKWATLIMQGQQNYLFAILPQLLLKMPTLPIMQFDRLKSPKQLVFWMIHVCYAGVAVKQKRALMSSFLCNSTVFVFSPSNLTDTDPSYINVLYNFFT